MAQRRSVEAGRTQGAAGRGRLCLWAGKGLGMSTFIGAVAIWSGLDGGSARRRAGGCDALRKAGGTVNAPSVAERRLLRLWPNRAPPPTCRRVAEMGGNV